MRLAAEHRGLVRSVVVISAETKPLPLPRVTMALVGASAPLARRKWFAKAQATQLGIPTDLIDEYLRDSASTTRETLVASVGENIRFTVPTGWRTHAGPTTVMVGASERRLMHESARITAGALPGCSMKTVEGAAHDIPFSRADVIAATLRAQIDA